MMYMTRYIYNMLMRHIRVVTERVTAETEATQFKR